MSPEHMKAARDGLYDANIAADILKALGTAHIGGGIALQGTSIVWLAERLEDALEAASGAVDAAGWGVVA